MADPVKKKRKYRLEPGTRALREIKKYQRSTELLIPKAPFARAVLETLPLVYRIRKIAIDVLQVAAEALMVELLDDAQKLAIHAKRITIHKRDLDMVLDLRRLSILSRVQ